MHRLLVIGLLILAAALSPRVADDKSGFSQLTLPDTTGQNHSIAKGNDKATVLFFASVQCPTANRYLGRLIEMHKEFAAQGVRFFAVYADGLDTPEEVRKHAADAKLPCPALLDGEQQLADIIRVSVVPTVILMDAEKRIRYRGAFDNNKTESLAKKPYLREALQAVLAGHEVKLAQTEPVGCKLQRKLKELGDAPVTYSGQVAGILHQHCATCHRPGQVAPFSLLTYDQARRWSQNIKEYTQSRVMPPWKPANHGTFVGERGLTAKELDALAKWADAGAPLGDPARVPAPPEFADGWLLGKPDVILEMPDYETQGSREDEYRIFVLDPKLTEDKYVQAVEFHPGNRRVVHHVMTYIDAFNVTAKRDGADGKPGFPSRGTGPGFFPAGDLGGWGPGMQPMPYPPGTARYLPKGSKIAMEVHYHTLGQRVRDKTILGLYFSKEAKPKKIHSQVILDLNLKIPPGAKRHEVFAEFEVPENWHAIAIAPHMHLIGREIIVTATPPGQPERTMVHIKEWDFNVQEIYRFKDAFALPAGTRIKLTGWFDNSADNANNPNHPPRLVRFGEQTTDEMCVAYIAYTKDQE